MAKITRKTASIFALGAAATDIEQFGSKVVVGVPNYTNDPVVIQALAAWATGWSAALVVANSSEYKQDRNAVDFVASYQIAYILQQGIAEWDAGTTYFLNSFVQNNGQLYQSLADNNTGNTPPASGATASWQTLYFLGARQPTRTVLGAGAGTYTPPVGCVRIDVQMVAAGGGGQGTGTGGGNGGNTVFGATTAGGGFGGNGNIGGAGGTAVGGYLAIVGANGFANAQGNGGSTFFGGAGGGNAGGSAGSGSGGSGFLVITGGGATVGAGGGAGGYIELTVNNPTPTAYSIGAGGTAGTGTTPGGSGGSGIIIIREYYY